MTVRQLLESLDARELAEWEIWYDIDPYGEGRADLRAGIVCATIHAMSGKVATDKLAPRDFMPFADRQPAAPQSPEEQQMICRTVAAALGQGQAVRKPVRSINA